MVSVVMRQVFWIFLAYVFGSAVSAQDLSHVPRAEMRAADIVVLGETHDNALHHAGQGALMQEIAPRAVIFEMLTPDMARGVDVTSIGDLQALDAAIGWSESGWPDITLYAPVFSALGDAAVVGAAMPRARVRAAFADGAAAVFGEGAARFGLTASLPEAELAARKQMQFEAHCEAMPLEMMGGMVEAQRLRDAYFARVALEALADHGAPVVVITGHGHARKDWGMPAALKAAAPEVEVFSVGFVEPPKDSDDPRFDATIVTEPAPRGDSCAAFR